LLNGLTGAVLLMCADGHVGGKIERRDALPAFKALFEKSSVANSNDVARRCKAAQRDKEIGLTSNERGLVP
jgi:hypothetical protein